MMVVKAKKASATATTMLAISVPSSVPMAVEVYDTSGAPKLYGDWNSIVPVSLSITLYVLVAKIMTAVAVQTSSVST